MKLQKYSSQVPLFAWSLSIIVSIIAVVVWGEGVGWKTSRLNAYSIFPLMGLLAFSLMWTHYIVGAARRLTSTPKEAVKQYFRVTGWIVLIAICLHPGLLVYQLWRDGLGLPPESYLTYYVAPTLAWAAGLGTVGLLAFLAFETKLWFEKKKWWPVIEYANIAAMFAIFVHALKLGGDLQTGWFRSLWFFYGISLAVSIVYILVDVKKKKRAH